MRFSVIIPLFNKAPYVAKAIGSVLSQTFADYELIIVDDGSQDDSFSIAAKTVEGHGNCQVIHQENAGVSMARNNGVACSRGDYLCFLDADDWWAPTFLERMDWLIREYPDAGIYGTNYFYVKNGRQRVCVTTGETGYINYCKVYSEKLQMPLTSITVAIPRQCFVAMGGFKPSLKVGEDFDLWIRIALQNRVAFLNEPLAYYNQDANPAWRAIGHLIDPNAHMLWNLGYLEKEEEVNSDYKQLIDNLRAYGLFPYYLSKQYREEARKELDKVDWSRQPEKTVKLYRRPVAFLRIRVFILRLGARVKQWILRHL
jgi:glycosyltransferase involved in cell wall biosynthesis